MGGPHPEYPMGQIQTLGSSGTFLRQRYESEKVKKGYFSQRRLLADVPKDTSLSGAAFQIDVKFAPMSTRAMNVPDALAIGGPDQYAPFNIPNINFDFSVAQVSEAAFAAASDDAGSMIKLKAQTLDGAYDTAYESVAVQLWGNGGVLRGVLANTNFNTPVATLTNVGDAVNFMTGGGFQASAASDDGTGGGGALNGGAIGYVVGVDYQGGTVTFNANLSTIWGASLAQNSGFFMSTDYGKGFVGLGGWNPYTAPSATTFFGVNRTQNLVGLSGWRVTGNGGPYEDSTMDLVARMCSIGALDDDTRRMYVNPIDWGQWSKTQNSKVIYDRGKVASFSTPDLMFEALMFMTPNGAMPILSDVQCPQGYGRIVQLSKMKLMSCGEICRPAMGWANMEWFPNYQDSTYQARMMTNAFLKIIQPDCFGVVKF
jgi:hypothetical protein